MEQDLNQTTLETSHRKQLAVFWTRMFGWLLTGCGAPIATFAVKFGLFSNTSYEIKYDELGNVVEASTTALNGWGIVSCILIGYTIIQILREVSKTFTGYSLTKQCIEGVLHKILPLVILFAVCYYLNGVIQQMMFCLAVIILTQLAAIPLNPLPKWRYEKQGVEDYTDLLTSAAKILKTAVKKGGS